jgi:DNA-binding GntR family transcriptional regulator
MPLPEGIRVVTRASARDQVYAALREGIVAGALQPGERLRDAELAELLGVSRTPVREALQRLEDEGFVETSASRWTRVSEVDRDQALQIYPAIWSLEALAVLFAGASIGERQIEEMEAANDRLRRALENGEGVEASEQDRVFHNVFVEKSGNPELANVLQDLKTKLRRVEITYFGGGVFAAESVEEHERILDALKSADYQAAAEAVASNWKQGLRRMLANQDDVANRGLLERLFLYGSRSDPAPAR